MKISCIQENLKQGLSLVTNVSNKNINLPILNNVLLEVKDGSIKLAATNLEIGITCTIRGKIEEPGAFTVEAKLLSDYVGLLPKERIDLTLTENQLSVSCNNNKTKIKGITASDFPLIPQITKDQPYICNADKLRQALSQVMFACAKNESRPEICGVYMSLKDNMITLTATDSYRLAERKILLEQGSSTNEQIVIVPARTMQEVNRMLSTYKDAIDLPENINIYIADGQIAFEYDVVEIVSRLIEGNYPDYEQIIPKKHETSVIVNISDLQKATKTASLFSKVGINDVNLEIIPGEDGNVTEGKIKVMSMNDQVGENVSTVSAHIEGLQNGIVINYSFLLDALNAMNSQEVKLEMIDSSSPCVLQPTGTNDGKESYLHIIMPIRQ